MLDPLLGKASLSWSPPVHQWFHSVSMPLLYPLGGARLGDRCPGRVLQVADVLGVWLGDRMPNWHFKLLLGNYFSSRR